MGENIKVHVNSSNVKYSEEFITARYEYKTTKVEKIGDKYEVYPETSLLGFRTDRRLPRLGVMLVGWGGNNGSTITAALEANRRKLEWRTRSGVQQANWYGSLTQASTVLLGNDSYGQDVHIPMCDMLPMVRPEDIVLDGWDISSMDIGSAMERAQVLDVGLQDLLKKSLGILKPRPSIYDADFIADNQVDRADNVIEGTKYEQYQQIRKDIRDFKQSSGVQHVIVLWTANTERFCKVAEGLNTTSIDLQKSVAANKKEISPSTLFAMASIMEKCTYINGSPQNTFVPGVMELAEQEGVFIAGDDFKSGQTKLKSVLVDFLISAGIKPVSIVSYNHLGNNDGKNLSAAAQFRSKEISKSNVVDDMVASNSILYGPKEHPDHTVVIKYVPYVGDSKRAMDEYTSEIMLGGHNTIVVHNTCEDSLLAAPIILDLVLLAELCSRIQVRREDSTEYTSLCPVLSILGYLCKAPVVAPGSPVVNALFRQRSCIENVMRACLGLPPLDHMQLEHKVHKSILYSSKQLLKEPPAKRTKTTSGTYCNGRNNVDN